MPSVNEVVEAYNTLPKSDQQKVLEILVEGEEQEKSEKESKKIYQNERYKKARKWLDENSETYMNQWVCLEGDKLIAHSKDGKGLYQKAVEAGIKTPFIHHIVEEPNFFYGGGYERILD